MVIKYVVQYQVFGSIIYNAIKVTYVWNIQIISVFEKLSQSFLIFSINGGDQTGRQYVRIETIKLLNSIDVRSSVLV